MQFPITNSKPSLEIKGFIPSVATKNHQNTFGIWSRLTISTSTTLAQATVISCLDYRDSPNGRPLSLSLWRHSLHGPLIDATLAAPSVPILPHSIPALSLGPLPLSSLQIMRSFRVGVRLLQHLSFAQAQGLAQSWYPVSKWLLNMLLNEWLNGQEWKEFLSCL